MFTTAGSISIRKMTDFYTTTAVFISDNQDVFEVQTLSFNSRGSTEVLLNPLEIGITDIFIHRPNFQRLKSNWVIDCQALSWPSEVFSLIIPWQLEQIKKKKSENDFRCFKWTIWYVLKKRSALASSATPKKKKEHRKQLRWVIAWTRTLHTSNQVSDSWEVGVSLSVYNHKTPSWN